MQDFENRNPGNLRIYPVTPVYIPWMYLPSEEQATARLIFDRIHSLSREIQAFWASVRLLDFCEEKRRLRSDMALHPDRYPDPKDRELLYDSEWSRLEFNWIEIAARHAAFTLYHFRATLASIRDQLKNCPTLRPFVDTKLVEATWTKFNADFPMVKEVRHAVGHSADQLFSVEEQRKHVPRGAIFGSSYSQRTLTLWRFQKPVRIEVSETSLDRLREIERAIHLAYRGAKALHPEPAKFDPQAR